MQLRSDSDLYFCILQHDIRDLTDQAQANEPLENMNDELEHLDSQDTDFEDSSSKNNDEMDDDIAFKFLEQQDFDHLRTGIFSKNHRLRMLDRNTFKWGMLVPPSNFCV